MDVKTTIGCFGALLGLSASCIWFYLLYQVLQMLKAPAAMWSAYWVYVPVGLIGTMLIYLSKEIGE